MNKLNAGLNMRIRFRDYREWGIVWIGILLVSFVAFQLCVTGCAVGPNFVPPEPPRVDRYNQGENPTTTISAEGQAQRFEEAAKVDADWWRLFNSPKLDAVMKEAFENNQSLQAAEASLRQSQENLRAGYGVFFPQIDTSLGISRHKSSVVSFSGSTISNIFNLYTLAATVSYALDVFGGERRAVESLQAQVDYQRFTVLGAYLTLSGNIVNTIIAQAGYRGQIEATEQTIDLEKEQISIAEAQAQAGIIPYSNLLSLQAQLSTTQATLPSLKQKLSQADHLLATLVGRAPGEWSSPQVGLADLTLPSDLPLSLPSELVRQRPDILAAEAQLHTASAQIGVATAALFPNFTLSGLFGLNSTSLQNLAKDTVSFWTLGANVAAPIFHGGSLWFGRRAVIEGYNQSLAGYRETVLSALAQVADTLRALEHDAETLEAQSEALGEAKEALELIQANYQAGTVNYLQVLVANYQYYQAKISYVEALAQRLQDTVAFYVALGGGWWNTEKNVSSN
jgi:NodT family efflux transporter outer membrane factor (OMF) lipoprotein